MALQLRKVTEESIFSQSKRQQYDHSLYRYIESVVSHSSYTPERNEKQKTQLKRFRYKTMQNAVSLCTIENHSDSPMELSGTPTRHFFH